MTTAETITSTRTTADVISLPRVPEVPEATSAALDAASRILNDLQKDAPVPDRTIIRWTSVHPINGAEFHYAAIFAGGAWYTSVGRDNDNVQKIMQHDDLVAYLNKKKANLKNVQMAVDFVTLSW